MRPWKRSPLGSSAPAWRRAKGEGNQQDPHAGSMAVCQYPAFVSNPFSRIGLGRMPWLSCAVEMKACIVTCHNRLVAIVYLVER